MLILASSGFRYDFKKHEIVKTGSLILETYPKAASVYIDNQPRQNLFSGSAWRTLFRIIAATQSQEQKNIQKTPLIINNLIPNEYLIKLTKPDYHPWVKRLTITSNEATFADQVLLFRLQPEIQALTQGNISQVQIAPDQQKTALLLNNTLKLLDIKTEQTTTLFETHDSIIDIKWNNTSQKILITEQKPEYKNYIIINAETGENTSVNSFQNYTPLDNLKWDHQNPNLIYGARKNTTYQINLFTKKIKPFLQIKTQSLDDFLIAKDWNIFYLKKWQENWCLNYVGLTTDGSSLRIEAISKTCLLELPLGSSQNQGTLYSLSKIDDELLLVQSPARADDFPGRGSSALAGDFFQRGHEQKIWLINTKTKEVILNETKAKDVLYLPASQTLIYYNDFEIWQTDLKNYDSNGKPLQDTRYILSRFSSEIKKIISTKEQNYLLLSLKNAGKDIIYALELDSRNRRNIVNLLEVKKIYNLFPNKDKNFIYLHAEIGDKNGIYKITIH